MKTYQGAVAIDQSQLCSTVDIGPPVDMQSRVNLGPLINPIRL